MVPTTADAAPTVDPVAVPDAAPTPAPPRRPRRRSRVPAVLAFVIVGALLIGAVASTVGVLYRTLYSPSAFVSRYLDLLGAGQAADALLLPGVAVGTAQLQAAGLPLDANQALLRTAALAPLSDVTIVSEIAEGDTVAVTVAYTAGPHAGRTTFLIEQAGWIGPSPTWRFAQSPLAVIDLTVRGSMQFTVNGFTLDKRQLTETPDALDPLAPQPLLVFSPGLYSISVDTPVSASPGVAVLSDAPQAQIPVEIQTQPTAELVAAVQDEVEGFLTTCATQQVLKPTGCPFGLDVQNRIVDPPQWSIAQQPTIALEPDGAHWRIVPTQAFAHVRVDIRTIFDGSIREVDEDVPFTLGGTVTILPDGSASIQVSDGT